MQEEELVPNSEIRREFANIEIENILFIYFKPGRIFRSINPPIVDDWEVIEAFFKVFKSGMTKPIGCLNEEEIMTFHLNKPALEPHLHLCARMDVLLRRALLKRYSLIGKVPGAPPASAFGTR